MQAASGLVKLDVHCHVQGDVVLECIHLDGDLIREEVIFRVMFHTAFVHSNNLKLNRDEVDIIWDAKGQFPKDFGVEVGCCFFSVNLFSLKSLNLKEYSYVRYFFWMLMMQCQTSLL